MNRIKQGILIMATILFGTAIFAQKLEDGRKFFSFEKYKSAKNVFSQLVAANPANVDATYWLGASMVELGDIAGAKALYQKALMANPNSPLLLVGMGHVELHEGKPQDARQRFETAISLSQNKNISVLNAVGYANADVKNGDVDYAIDVLKQATTLKGMKDPDVYINLGDAYRKKWDGSSAMTAYENALNLNKNYARASYKIGKIYQTQGPSQEDVFMKYYNDAIEEDSTFPPVYFQLYDYYYKRDVTKSSQYLDKFMQYADPDPKNCYYTASLAYASGLFTECIAKAEGCLNSDGVNAYVKLYGLKAFSYDKLGDSLNAKLNFDKYFSMQDPKELGPTDYSTYAKNLLKFPGNDSLAGDCIDKAVLLDSTENGKVLLYRTMAMYYDQQKNYLAEANWFNKILTVKKSPNNIDLYFTGLNYMRGADYKSSINIFNQYIQKYPNETFGYYMNAKNYLSLDSTDANGDALANYIKIANMSDTTLKSKPGEIDRYKNSLRYLIEFYANVKKDKTNALLYCDKGIQIDPTDTEFVLIKDQIMKLNTKPATTKPPVKKKTDE